jgi:ankyrin repeat protein
MASIRHETFLLLLQAGWTALHMAAWKGHPTVVGLLLGGGADLHATTKVTAPKWTSFL